VANIAGHYPWFVTYNYLDSVLQKKDEEEQGGHDDDYHHHHHHHDDLKTRLARNAMIGFMASLASDTVSNCFHVVKIHKQASSEMMSYGDAARRVVAADGMIGLFGRGLGIKLLGNGLQGMTFGVLWRLMDEMVFYQPSSSSTREEEEDHHHHHHSSATTTTSVYNLAPA